MADIFLSYSREDQDRVEHIIEVLEGRGYKVFWDQHVPPGVNWNQWLKLQLEACKCAVVLWSKSSVLSDNVAHEATIAKEDGKYLGAYLDKLSAKSLPVGFHHGQLADLSGWSGEDGHAQWTALLEQIEERCIPKGVLHDLRIARIGQGEAERKLESAGGAREADGELKTALEEAESAAQAKAAEAAALRRELGKRQGLRRLGIAALCALMVFGGLVLSPLINSMLGNPLSFNTAADGEIERLRKELATEKKATETSTAAGNDLRSKLDGAEGRIETLEGELARSTVRAEHDEKLKSELDQKLKTAQDAEASLQTRIASLQSGIDEESGKLAAQKEAHANELKELTARIKVLQVDLKKANESLKANRKLKIQITNLVEKNNRHKGYLRKTEKKLHESNRKIANYELEKLLEKNRLKINKESNNGTLTSALFSRIFPIYKIQKETAIIGNKTNSFGYKNIKKCKAECDFNQKCKGFTFYFGLDSCQLYDKIEGTRFWADTEAHTKHYDN